MVPDASPMPSPESTGIVRPDVPGVIFCTAGVAFPLSPGAALDELLVVELELELEEELDELELAYAVTIHKSQGSEYPAVIMPLLGGPRMLFSRNLLYTGVTRARRCVIILGSREVVKEMIDNADEQKRYTGLADCIREAGIRGGM